MNWADKSVRRAKGIAPEHPVPEEPGELRNRAIELNNRAESARIGYFMGAQWQREQLRTPEAIEKAADILSFQTTGGCYPKADEQCRQVMKEVFDALLGED